MASSPAVQPAETASVIWTAELVTAELEQAFRTLRALPSGGHSQQTRVSALGAVLELLGGPSGASWPAEPGPLKPPIPSAARITRMDEVLRWLSLIPDDRPVLRRIVGLRSITHFATCRPTPWAAVAREAGCATPAAKVWHATGTTIITRRLNAAGVPLPRRHGER